VLTTLMSTGLGGASLPSYCTSDRVVELALGVVFRAAVEAELLVIEIEAGNEQPEAVVRSCPGKPILSEG
jgi:hypothetical protein